MSLHEAFQWLGDTPPGLFLRGSTLAFAFVQSVHLLGIAALAGAVVTTDLAALGVLFRTTPPEVIARGAAKVFWAALGVMAVSGLLLVAAGPLKYYSNPLFPVKLALLAGAIVLHLLVRAALRGGRDRPSPVARIAASGSLSAWFAVLIAGRWLGLI